MAGIRGREEVPHVLRTGARAAVFTHDLFAIGRLIWDGSNDQPQLCRDHAREKIPHVSKRTDSNAASASETSAPTGAKMMAASSDCGFSSEPGPDPASEDAKCAVRCRPPREGFGYDPYFGCRCRREEFPHVLGPAHAQRDMPHPPARFASLDRRRLWGDGVNAWRREEPQLTATGSYNL